MTMNEKGREQGAWGRECANMLDMTSFSIGF